MQVSQVQFSSVQSLSHVHSLRHHGLQHTRPPCPLPNPWVYSNSCPLSLWCHPTISFCPLLLLLPSIFPSIKVFSNESVLHISPQSTGASASALVFPMNIQDWFPLGVIGWISLQSKGLSSLLQYHSLKASVLWRSAFFMVQLSLSTHDYWKNHTLTIGTFVNKVTSLLFNM